MEEEEKKSLSWTTRKDLIMIDKWINWTTTQFHCANSTHTIAMPQTTRFSCTDMEPFLGNLSFTITAKARRRQDVTMKHLDYTSLVKSVCYIYFCRCRHCSSLRRPKFGWAKCYAQLCALSHLVLPARPPYKPCYRPQIIVHTSCLVASITLHCAWDLQL